MEKNIFKLEKKLKLRILTAVFLVPIILIALFALPLFWFGWFSALIFMAAAWEWTNLIHVDRPLHKIFFLLGFLVLIYVLGHLLAPAFILILGAITWFAITFFVFNYRLFKQVWPLKKAVQIGVGLWLLALCWFGLNFVRWQDDGRFLVFILFLIVWGTDTASYFSGKRWGKRKLAPEISPGKTIEGVLGGVATAFVIGLIVSAFLPVNFTTYFLFLLVILLTIIISIVGDLFESMVKRQSNLKDSGQLLPGHGGILDRIDSIISAAPIFAAGLFWIERFNGFFA